MTGSTYGVDVLAFGAHPDDVEIFCGGTMVRLRDLGYSTGIVDLTRGERATHGTVEIRAREAEAAAKVLGLSVRENLGLPDGAVTCGEDRGQVDTVVDALRRHRPEIVLVPWIEERHPDHAAAGRLLLRAVFLAGLPPAFRPRQMLHYAMRHRMRATFIVDTTGAWPRKLEAIRCHASQVAPAEGSAPTLIGSSGAIAAIEARDRYHGSMIGTAFGEALRTPNVPGLRDPVAHFRDNPFGPAHAFEGAE